MLRVSLRIGDDAHARLGPLAMNVNVDRKITDEHIRAYMRATLTAARRDWARVSLSCFAHDVPNARQRRIIVDELAAFGARPIERTVLLTDSALMRGALTAFSWVAGTDSAAYGVADRRAALAWLAQKAPFDVPEALTLLEGCFRDLGHALR